MRASAPRIATAAPAPGAWRRLVRGRYGPWLTHGSLLLLTSALFALLLALPFWLAFLPCAVIQHRIGVLLHEYIHGIPFTRYKSNLRVLTFFDGLLLMFGLLELFRGTHLAHHRWLNTDRDPAFTAAHDHRSGTWGVIAALEGIQHLIYLVQALRGGRPYVQPSRLAFGMGLSLVWIGAWILLGYATLPLKLIGLAIYNTLVPVSFRGAIEHHSHPGDEGFANEYRVVVPLFNLNRHIHHHENPRLPWYLLEYRTERPLWTWHYFTYWFRVYIIRDFVLMRPFRRG